MDEQLGIGFKVVKEKCDKKIMFFEMFDFRRLVVQVYMYKVFLLMLIEQEVVMIYGD